MAKRIIYNPKRNELFFEAASYLIDTINAINQQQIVIALCGGRSIVGLLQNLNEQREKLSREIWRRFHFFMLDERLVPIDHPDSNFRLVNELFLQGAVNEGLLQVNQLHPFVLNAEVGDLGVGMYCQELTKFGGRFDVSFLGVGEDAHVGALFPNHHSIADDSPLYFSMKDSPKPPPKRMTASRALIKSSQLALALFLGEDKRTAYNAYQNPALSVEKCPVKLVDQAANTLLITDLI